MPSPLKFWRFDPNNMGRGAGWYYYRGTPKGRYSKYDDSKTGRDAQTVRGPVRNNSRNLKDSYRHTEDYSSFEASPNYPTNTKSYAKRHELRPETIKRRKKLKRFRIRRFRKR